MNLPGFDFHMLRGKPVRFSVYVNGPWCITFGWEEDALAVDLENYHWEKGICEMAKYRAGRPAHQPSHPGALLREDVLPALAISVKDAAAKLGVSRQSLHAILVERASISVEMAVRLGKLCGNGPLLWLRMQQAHDLWKAERDLAKALSEIPTLHAA